MIQNDGQPQLNEDGSVTTPDPSDTHRHTSEPRKEGSDELHQE